MDKSQTGISKFDTEYLKGVAILLIMFHNLFHLMKDAPGENEFNFHSETFVLLYQNILNAPQDIVKQLFAFFGHHGVQLFIFLSGYGLAVKYTGKEIPFIKFLKERLQKLYPLLILGIIFLFIYQVAESFFFPSAVKLDILSFAGDSLLRLSLLANIIPDKALVLCGPWWFFSLVFQLYFLFPFILKISNKWIVALILAVWCCQFAVINFVPSIENNLRYNFLGHLPEFCLGIYFAKNRMNAPSFSATLLATLVFIGSFFNEYLWVISFITIPIIMLYIHHLVSPSPTSRISKVVLFFGANSMYLFVVHGFLRKPFIQLGNQSVLMSLAAGVLYMIWVLIVTKLFKEVLEYTLKRFRVSSV